MQLNCKVIKSGNPPFLHEPPFSGLPPPPPPLSIKIFDPIPTTVTQFLEGPT